MYRKDKFNEIPVPENLDQIIDQSIEKGIKMKKNKRKNKIIGVCTGLAAAAATFSVVCISFPSFAGKLPLIGRIFSQVEEQVSYKGDFSALAETLVTEQETGEEAGTEQADSSYVQSDNGITITISEAYCSSQALYLAMSIENEEAFPADFIKTKNMEGYQWDYDTLLLEGIEKYDFKDPYTEEGDFFGEYIEGQFEDDHTFVGIYRLDLSHLSWWPTKKEMEEKGLTEEKGNIDSDTIKAVFPEAGSRIEVPETFHYSFQINGIIQEVFETEEITAINAEGETETFQDPVCKEYEGSWNFELDVKRDIERAEKVEINKTNDNGLGIASVERTPYEISAKEIFPEGDDGYDYFTVICDAEGDLLDYQGSAADIYQTYGRNTDTVYVYICDYVEYMDEIKGYYWSEDYQEKKKTKTFKQYLDEKALYGVEVNFQ